MSKYGPKCAYGSIPWDDMHGAGKILLGKSRRTLAEFCENLIFAGRPVNLSRRWINGMTMKRGRKIWLVTTEHLEDGLWFRDDADFKVGMNYVAVQVAVSNVVVLVFILMSNHVHFVLFGTWEEVVAFVNGYKMRYAKYLQRKYGVREFLRRNGVDIREVPEDEGEAVERAIAYVQMNCVAANICSHPTHYSWGCGQAFFHPAKAGGRPLGEISARAKRRMLHCAMDLPDTWLLGEDGYVIPACYVNVRYVEQLYRTPNRMNYFLNTSSKARKRVVSGETGLPSFRDQVVLPAVPELCKSLFSKSSFGDLEREEQVELLRQLRFRFSSDVNQLARVTGLTYAAAARLLEDSE